MLIPVSCARLVFHSNWFSSFSLDKTHSFLYRYWLCIVYPYGVELIDDDSVFITSLLITYTKFKSFEYISYTWCSKSKVGYLFIFYLLIDLINFSKSLQKLSFNFNLNIDYFID